MTLEKRYSQATEIRLIEAAGQPTKIAGYAAKFGVDSQDLGGFIESIRAGAFKRTLASGADIKCFCQHDPSLILGRTKNQTLTIREDEQGLYFECQLPATSYGQDMAASIKRGDIDGMSFGFAVPDGGDSWSIKNGRNHRELVDIDLAEVSPVTYPAYLDTVVSVRAIDRAKELKASEQTKQPDKDRLSLRLRLLQSE